jgi:hypothetical protein
LRRLRKIVTTLVMGTDGCEFLVHQNRLYERSPYFAAATKEDWKEGQEHRIPLPDDNPSGVGLYIQWIYGGRIFSRPSERESEINDKPIYNETSLLVEGFIFGEKIQDGDFKDAIIDAMILSINTLGKDDKHWYPSGPAVDRAYEGTPEGSPLRKLMVDIHVNHGSRKWLEAVTNIDFVKDLAEDLYVDRESTAFRTNPTAAHLKSCGYHHHGAKGPCYSEMM